MEKTRNNIIVSISTIIVGFIFLIGGLGYTYIPKVKKVNTASTVAIRKGSLHQTNLTYTYDKEPKTERLREYAVRKYNAHYTSSTPETASVDENGLIATHATGDTEITIEGANGYSTTGTSCKVHVYENAQKLKMPKTVQLVKNVDESGDVAVTVYPADATDYDITYESADESIISVDDKGKIVGVGNGDCEVTAILSSPYMENDLTSKTTIHVDTMPTEIHAGNDKTLYVGGSYTIPISFTPEDSTLCGYETSSSDSSIVSVSGNKATAKKTGTATITVKSTETDISTTIKIVVKEKTKNELASTGAMGNCGRLSIPSVGYSARLNSPLTQANCDAADSAAFDGCLVADHWNQGFSAMKASVPGSTHAYIRTSSGVKDYICTANFRGTNTGTALLDSAGNNVMHGASLVMYTCNGADWTNVTITFWSLVG